MHLNWTSEWKVMTIWLSRELPLFNFERLDILLVWIRTFDSKVMTVWICLALWCLMSSISIYYAPQSDIRVKSYDHSTLSRASVVQFRASRYIIGLNRTSESKVGAVLIFLALWCFSCSISIHYAPESDIRVQSYDHLNFSKTSIVQFRASRYMIDLNRTSESKVMAVWIFLVFLSLISASRYIMLLNRTFE